MPKYDLRCAGCGGEHSIRASISEKTEGRIACPDCGSADLVTVFKSPPSVIVGAAKCPDSGACGSAGCRHAS